MSEKFMKDDEGKVMLELIEPKFIMELGRVLSIGAKKYSRNNWKSMSIEDRERVKGAMLRHTYKYLDDKTYDEDSMLHQLAHVVANAMFLMYFDFNMESLDNGHN